MTETDSQYQTIFVYFISCKTETGYHLIDAFIGLGRNSYNVRNFAIRNIMESRNHGRKESLLIFRTYKINYINKYIHNLSGRKETLG